MDKEYTPRKKAVLNMVQFRHDYNKVKNTTKTTHERYILEMFRGMIIENTISSEYAETKAKMGSMYGSVNKEGGESHE